MEQDERALATMIEWRVMRRDEEGLIRVILVLRVQGWTDSGIDPI